MFPGRGSLPLHDCIADKTAYIAILVVQVDDESEGPASHGLRGDEGVLEGRLSAGRNHEAQLEGCEVLDVELEILGETRTTEPRLIAAAGPYLNPLLSYLLLWISSNSNIRSAQF